MLIIYESNDEVLVCTAENEVDFLAEFFYTSSGRELEDYNREESKTVAITFTTRVRTY